MKTNVTLFSSISIKGNFDTYKIEQGEDGKFYTTSENGYHDFGTKSLVSAISKVNKMIKTEYTDRCLDKPANSFIIDDNGAGIYLDK